MPFLNAQPQSEEDSDLLVEDETIEEEVDHSHKASKKNKQIQEDNDEFDDPNLLQRNRHNQQIPKKPKVQARTYDDINLDSLKEEEEEEKVSKLYLLAHYEIIMCSLVLIYIINVFIGKSKNSSIAQSWWNKNKKFLEDNYAHWGPDREYNPKLTTLWIKDSYNSFKFFSSGRVYTNWMLMSMTLKKRQDLISMLQSLFLFGEKDKITYQTSINPTSEIPVIFCICKKKDTKSWKKSYIELDEFTELTTPSYMADNLVMLSENQDFVDKLLKEKNLMEYYKKIEPYIDTIFYSDRKSFTKETNAIYFTFDITNRENDDILYDMTVFVHILIDVLCTSSVKAGYKKEAEHRRKEHDNRISRELAEKNAEEIKNLKEEKKNAQSNKQMTREQAQKLEEKEKKESLKHQRKKMFKVVKN